MTRIFEALEQVGLDREGRPNIIDFPEAAEDRYGDRIRAKMRGLYRKIDAQCPGHTGKVVQFIGARRGVGTSRLIRTFARVCADSLEKSVLLVDTEIASPQFSHFGIEPTQTWSDALRSKSSPESVLCRVPRVGLHLIKAFGGTQSVATLLESPLLREHVADLKESFDLILVDSEPADGSPDGLDLAIIVDASVLIVEAEKTRWQVAQAVKKSLEERAGNVVGVLLNKLQLHIPAAIYSRL